MESSEEDEIERLRIDGVQEKKDEIGFRRLDPEREEATMRERAISIC